MTIAHALEHLVDVDVGHHARRPVRNEQAVDQRLQAVGLGDDDARVLALVRRQFGLEQLRGAAHAAQRVLDLVREVAQQLAVGFGQPELALLAVDLQLLLDLRHLEHHRGRLAELRGRRHLHVQEARAPRAAVP